MFIFGSPAFECILISHLYSVFPLLEAFHFQALEEVSYWFWNKDDPDNTFLKAMLTLIQKMPNLRVIKLDDNFKKPDLSKVVEAFYYRAIENPSKQYALYIDKHKNCKNKHILRRSVKEVDNLRVF